MVKSKYDFFLSASGLSGGALSELEIEALKNAGATSSSINEAWIDYLSSQGYTSGGLNDRMYKWLADKGYSGTLEDKLSQLYENEQSLGAIALSAFTRTVGTVGWYAAATQPPALYNPSTNETYVAYTVVSLGDDSGLFCHIRAYNHTTKEWGDAYSVGRRHNISDDNHGVPSMAINGDGRIVVFWGGHNTDLYMAVSTNVGDISQWEEHKTLSGSYTYPHPFTLADGSVGVLLRTREFPGATFPTGAYPCAYRNITFSGANATVGSEVDVGNMGDDSRWYMGSTYRRTGDKIHQVCSRANYSDTYRKNVYYMVHDPVAETTSNARGTVTHAWPIEEADLVDFVIYTHDSSSSITGNIPFMVFDTSGRKHITYNVGAASGAGGTYDLSDQEFFHLIVSADGATVSTGVKITDGDQRYETVTMTPRSDGSVALYYPSESDVRGGDLMRRVVPNGGTSSDMSAEESLASFDVSRNPFFQFYGVMDKDGDPGSSDIEVIFCELASSANNSDGTNNRAFAYGRAQPANRDSKPDPTLPSCYAAWDCGDATSLYDDTGGTTLISGSDNDSVRRINDVSGNGIDLTLHGGSSRTGLYRVADSGNFVQIGSQRNNVDNTVRLCVFRAEDTDAVSDGELSVIMGIRPLNFEAVGHILAMDDGSGGDRNFIFNHDPANRRIRGVMHNTGNNHAESPNGTAVTASDMVASLIMDTTGSSIRVNGVQQDTGGALTATASQQIYVGAQNSTLANNAAFRLYRAILLKGVPTLQEIEEAEAWVYAGFDKV